MVLSLNMSRCHSVMLFRLRARFGRMMLFRTVARLASLVLSLLLSRSGEMELSAWMSRFDGTVAIPVNGSLEENGSLEQVGYSVEKGLWRPGGRRYRDHSASMARCGEIALLHARV